jgi:hypothetical protein
MAGYLFSDSKLRLFLEGADLLILRDGTHVCFRKGYSPSRESALGSIHWDELNCSNSVLVFKLMSGSIRL